MSQIFNIHIHFNPTEKHRNPDHRRLPAREAAEKREGDRPPGHQQQPTERACVLPNHEGAQRKGNGFSQEQITLDWVEVDEDDIREKVESYEEQTKIVEGTQISENQLCSQSESLKFKYSSRNQKLDNISAP
ncbi:Hypothetical_protein [Hexamita inflata]|uniref:Hypothetical_protein n=1 Tax=Hexamita inflata TaxID=28002 RepID=A0AA86TLY8_9EUKA|nr:Hypothetical protein HINF_LOCUS10274 [Hexamita inflata]